MKSKCDLNTLRNILSNDGGVEWKTLKSSFKSVGGVAAKTIPPKSMMRSAGGVAMKIKLIPYARDGGGVAESKFNIELKKTVDYKLKASFLISLFSMQ